MCNESERTIMLQIARLGAFGQSHSIGSFAHPIVLHFGESLPRTKTLILIKIYHCESNSGTGWSIVYCLGWHNGSVPAIHPNETPERRFSASQPAARHPSELQISPQDSIWGNPPQKDQSRSEWKTMSYFADFRDFFPLLAVKVLPTRCISFIARAC